MHNEHRSQPSGYMPDGGFDPSCTSAEWIFDSEMDPWPPHEIVRVEPEVDTAWRERAQEVKPLPVVAFCRDVTVGDGMKSASVRLSALGIVDVRVNGRFEPAIPRMWPGWTDYNHRVPCARFGLGFVQPGAENRVELLLSGGWYAGYLGWERNRGYYGRLPAVWAEIVLEYEDGRYEIVATDTHWSVEPTEWQEADLYMGETVDFRVNPNQARRSAQIWAGHKPEIIAADWEPVRVVEKLHPVSVEPFGGGWMVDFGQNHCGVPGFRLAPKAEVVLGFGEVLQADGSLYTENYRMARTVDTVRSGNEAVDYVGRFTSHGYRYAHITGDVGAIGEGSLVSNRLVSDVGRVGAFECDNPRLQELYGMYIQSSESNLVDISTDCPQRDERLGWTGDGSILAEAHTMTWDLERFYAKWLVDVALCQREDGAIPDIVPYVDFQSGIVGWNNAAWSDACILVTQACMHAYGFETTARSLWTPWLRYLDSIWVSSDNGQRPPAGHGDWLATESTPKDFIATAYHIAVLDAMVDIGSRLGEDTSELTRRSLLTRDQFAASQAPKVGSFTQTQCVLCLKYDLLPDATQDIRQRLIENLTTNGGYLSTGFLGTAHLPFVLSQMGRHDLVMQLFANNEHPSWGFMLRHGATTFWEHWDSWHPDTGYRHPIMNSFNHASLGAFSYWFYRVAGWLDTVDIKARRIAVKPADIPGLNRVSVVRESPLGTIRLKWQRIDGAFKLHVNVPEHVVIDWNFEHIPSSDVAVTYDQ